MDGRRQPTTSIQAHVKLVFLQVGNEHAKFFT